VPANGSSALDDNEEQKVELGIQSEYNQRQGLVNELQVEEMHLPSLQLQSIDAS